MGKLTERQAEVLKGFGECKTVKEIGVELGVSSKTVEFHLAKVRQKYKLPSAAHLIHFALQSRIAENLYSHLDPDQLARRTSDVKIVIRSNVPVTKVDHTRKLHHIREAIEALKLADSFPIFERNNTLWQIAKQAGVKITMRCEQKIKRGEDRHAERWYRIWRTDGLSWKELNRIIAQRQRNGGTSGARAGDPGTGHRRG